MATLTNGNGDHFDDVLQHCIQDIENGLMTVEECIAQYPQYTELGDLLRIATSVIDMPRLMMPASDVAQMRNKLQAEFRQRVRVAPPVRSGWNWTVFQRLAAVLLVALLILGGGGFTLAKASENAIPGDSLYGVKRTVEQVELTFASSESRPALLYDQAKTRLNELNLLTARNLKADDAFGNDVSTSIDAALAASISANERNALVTESLTTLRQAKDSGTLNAALADTLIAKLEVVQTVLNPTIASTNTPTPTLLPPTTSSESTATATAMPTFTLTNTVVVNTAAPTATATSTPTFTVTPQVIVPTATATYTATVNPTATMGQGGAVIITGIPTRASGATAIISTGVPGATATPTATPQGDNTTEPGETPVNATPVELSPTPTFTETVEPTATFTDTPTATPTPTFTETPTPIPPTATPTFTPTFALPSVQFKQTPELADFNECPPEGQEGDPDLNRLRNRTDNGNYQTVPFDAIATLKWPKDAEGKLRKDWSQPVRDEINHAEGLPVVIEGYLVKVQENEPEPQNCQSPDQKTWQLWLLGTPGTANDLSRALIAQITPRIRARHEGWTLDKLNPLAASGAKVRISGWLNFNQQKAGDVTKNRISLWEIHPILQVQIWKDNQWINLD